MEGTVSVTCCCPDDPVHSSTKWAVVPNKHHGLILPVISVVVVAVVVAVVSREQLHLESWTWTVGRLTHGRVCAIHSSETVVKTLFFLVLQASSFQSTL